MSQTESGESGDSGTNMVGIESTGALISMLVAWIWMIGLQGLLLILYRSGKSRPGKGKPRPEELFLGVTIFWTSQLILGQALAGVGTILSIGLSEFASNRHLREVYPQNVGTGYGYATLGCKWLWGVITVLLRRILLTWTIHLGLVFLLDTGIPFWQALRQNPQKAMQKMELRSKELLSFMESTLQDPFADLSPKPDDDREEILKTGEQRISLERRQVDLPNEGQRRLSWNVVVDKDAMDEMKQTLGPPGGFGELGFNVAKDGVRFEAMGVGTSFNLMFKLREDDEKARVRESKQRKKRK